MIIPNIYKNVGPSTKTNLAPVSSVGSVYDAGNMIGESTLPQAITFQLNNLISFRGPGPSQNFLMFDNSGLFKANSGMITVPPSSASSSVQGIFGMSGNSQILIKGFSYQVTTSPTQFNHSLRLTLADADGSTDIRSVDAQQAKRNTQFQQNLLTFECAIYIDTFRGLLLTVNPNELVNLTVFLAAGYNRQ